MSVTSPVSAIAVFISTHRREELTLLLRRKGVEMIQKQLSISEDEEGKQEVRYLEFDRSGKQTKNQARGITKENSLDLTEEYERIQISLDGDEQIDTIAHPKANLAVLGELHGNVAEGSDQEAVAAGPQKPSPSNASNNEASDIDYSNDKAKVNADFLPDSFPCIGGLKEKGIFTYQDLQQLNGDYNQLGFGDTNAAQITIAMRAAGKEKK